VPFSVAPQIRANIVSDRVNTEANTDAEASPRPEFRGSFATKFHRPKRNFVAPPRNLISPLPVALVIFS
jgi:hypothetical protein